MRRRCCGRSSTTCCTASACNPPCCSCARPTWRRWCGRSSSCAGREQPGPATHSEIDPALQAWSLADGLRLRQVLFNLAGNALVRRGAWCCRSLQQREGGQQPHLQVTDTGVGISVERQQAVFAAYEQAEASTTRRFGGSGLGCRSAASWRRRWAGASTCAACPARAPPCGWSWTWRPAAPRRDRRRHGPRNDRCHRRGCWWPRIIRPTCSCWHNACASWACRCTPATACRPGRPGGSRSTW